MSNIRQSISFYILSFSHRSIIIRGLNYLGIKMQKCRLMNILLKYDLQGYLSKNDGFSLINKIYEFSLPGQIWISNFLAWLIWIFEGQICEIIRNNLIFIVLSEIFTSIQIKIFNLWIPWLLQFELYNYIIFTENWMKIMNNDAIVNDFWTPTPPLTP